MSDRRIGFGEVDIARNRAMGIGEVVDPHPRLHELRRTGPVHPGTISEHFGVDGPDRSMFPGCEQVSVFGYEEAEAVFRDATTFSSSWFARTLEPAIGRSIIQMDPPEHQRQRLILQPAFARREMRWWETDYVAPTCHHYIDQFAGRGRADLLAEYCVRVPVHVISLALGLPTADLPWFRDLAVRIVSGVADPAVAAASNLELEQRLRPLVAQRRRERGRDLISALVHGEVAGPDGEPEHLSDPEILTFIKLLLPAGANTTYRTLALALVALLRHPEQLEAVRRDRLLVDAWIEETLRWEQPLTTAGRVCACDARIGAVPVRAGMVVNLSLAAANRDPHRWPDPDRFDLFRPRQPNLAFAWGEHRCLGVHMARMELRVALQALLDRLPDLRLDPALPPPLITGLSFRMPDAVPVVWGV